MGDLPWCYRQRNSHPVVGHETTVGTYTLLCPRLHGSYVNISSQLPLPSRGPSTPLKDNNIRYLPNLYTLFLSAQSFLHVAVIYCILVSLLVSLRTGLCTPCVYESTQTLCLPTRCPHHRYRLLCLNGHRLKTNMRSCWHSCAVLKAVDMGRLLSSRSEGSPWKHPFLTPPLQSANAWVSFPMWVSVRFAVSHASLHLWRVDCCKRPCLTVCC